MGPSGPSRLGGWFSPFIGIFGVLFFDKPFQCKTVIGLQILQGIILFHSRVGDTQRAIIRKTFHGIFHMGEGREHYRGNIAIIKGFGNFQNRSPV